MNGNSVVVEPCTLCADTQPTCAVKLSRRRREKREHV